MFENYDVFFKCVFIVLLIGINRIYSVNINTVGVYTDDIFAFDNDTSSIIINDVQYIGFFDINSMFSISLNFNQLYQVIIEYGYIWMCNNRTNMDMFHLKINGDILRSTALNGNIIDGDYDMNCSDVISVNDTSMFEGNVSVGYNLTFNLESSNMDILWGIKIYSINVKNVETSFPTTNPTYPPTIISGTFHGCVSIFCSNDIL